MDPPVDGLASAWQPLTPSGVAAFARASWRRLLLIQAVAALLAAAAMVWCLRAAWYPCIASAIEHLPQQGLITSGRLIWLGDSPQLLAECRFLAFDVDLNHAARTRSPAHLQLQFGRSNLRVYSLFGWLQVDYPKGYAIAFNFQELKPWWGAWAPAISALAGFAVFLGLFVAWIALASLYALPAWLLGLYLNRQLSFWGGWKLAGAALMPGALVMTVGVIFYGLAQLDVVQMITAFSLHFLVGWAYLVLGVWRAPKIAVQGSKSNPFSGKPSGKLKGQPESDASNPFRPSQH